MLEYNAEYINDKHPSEVVAVIAPDQAAGDDFLKTLTQNNVDAVLFQRETPARVVNNELTQNPQKVSEALSSHITETIEAGHRIITISCNTESLPHFIDEAHRLAAEKGYAHNRDYILITTLDALKEEYPNREERPIFLGTTVISEKLSPEEFKTLSNSGYDVIQKDIQEIIWRVKATQGSAYSTAPYYEGALDDQDILDNKLIKLAHSLNEAKLKEVIMGCTELPIAFARLRKLVPDFDIKTIDPAVAVANCVKKELNKMA